MGDDMDKAAEGFWARINHPVIGAFITSALIWNWYVVYFIIRGIGTPIETAFYVNANYLNWGNWKNLILDPAILTFLFLLSAPGLHEGYSKYKEWWNAFAQKFSPIFNFVYEKTREEHKKAINVLNDTNYSLKNEMQEADKAHFEEMQKRIYEMEVLKAKFEFANKRIVGVPGYGPQTPEVIIEQFIKLKSENPRLHGNVLDLERSVGQKQNEIEQLKRKIAELESK